MVQYVSARAESMNERSAIPVTLAALTTPRRGSETRRPLVRARDSLVIAPTLGQARDVELSVLKHCYVICHSESQKSLFFASRIYCLVLRVHYTRLFPDPRFLLFVLQNIAVTKMRLNVCFNEMALFGLFAALIKGCSSYGRNGGQSTGGDG